MENRIYKTTTLHPSRSSQRLKFKEIPINKDFNQLNTKYEVYRQGTPNTYCENMQMLRAKNVRGEMGMVDLPALDCFISHMADVNKDGHINQRNYDLYPTLLKPNSTKYKEVLSEKQEVKDFIIWFQNQYQNIQKNSQDFYKKFQEKQTLIAAGFAQMVVQISKTSKCRGQILKMLWNRQYSQVSGAIDTLSTQKIRTEKELLQQISGLHGEYQGEIEQLRQGRQELQLKLSRQSNFSGSCVTNLRLMRRRIKKLQYCGRRLQENNVALRKENLHLMEQNIKLLSNIREISQEEAVVLNYRKLQIHHIKQQLKRNSKQRLMSLARQEMTSEQQESLTPLIDLQTKKNSLNQYFLERIKQNPAEKAIIREDYFMDEDETNSQQAIEQYFKSVLNRPQVQMELLNQTHGLPATRDRATNTDPLNQEPTRQMTSTLSLDKGIQVELQVPRNRTSSSGEGKDNIDHRVYHVTDEKEQQQKQQECKLRIIQHRISRKNSLTLLQLQGISDPSTRLFDRKGPMASGFIRNNLRNPSEIESSKISITNSERASDRSDSDSQGILDEDISRNNELIVINVRQPSMVGRKSNLFKSMLQNISQIREEQPKEQVKEDTSEKHIIKLEGNVEEQLRQGQLEDLIAKHLLKCQVSPVQNPEKTLNKILLALFRNVWHRRGINFMFQLLEVTKTSYGNLKSVIWKFLSVVALIRRCQQANPLIKIVSILLKINDHFLPYAPINTPELTDIYFQLFTALSIKNLNDTSFNLWKSSTTINKLRSLEFMGLLQQWFSEKKRRYIQNKISEFVAVSETDTKSKRTSKNTSSNRIQILAEETDIIRLNPLLLYIIQVYLIEKQLYHSSYTNMLAFLTEDALIPTHTFLWLLELLGLNEQKQRKVIEFALPQPESRKSSQEGNLYPKHVKVDVFYRCCVKFDLPIFEEMSISSHALFKQLPMDVQQNYFRMIGLTEWNTIKLNLINKFKHNCELPFYAQAYLNIADKLEREIRKGASIYGGYCEEEKLRKKEQIFALFYKILIIEAHRDLMGQNK